MTTERRPTLDPGYFEAIYARDPDPWGFRTSAYEAGKYAATLDALARPRYRAALEVGCSIGVLTQQLAGRCETLMAVDASDRALAIARQDCRDLSHVTFRKASLPAEFPAQPYDLIVLSEVLYYLSVADLRRLAELCTTWLEPDGEILLCHWLGETDYPLTGDDAATLFIEATIKRWPVHHAVRHEAYRLDRLTSSQTQGGPATTR